jgi:ribonuclease PH
MRKKRKQNEIRPLSVTVEYIKGEKSSILFELGYTRVLCVSTIQHGVPKFLEEQSMGWISAEYGMLPRSSPNRIQRERVSLSGRSYEIQRFIGRSLRASCDLGLLDGYTILIDVDVIQADGGTRVAAINGGMMSLYLLLRDMVTQGLIEKMPVTSLIGAISIGIQNSKVLLDPNYEEDSTLDVDMNVVMNERNEIIEIHAVTEGNPFSVGDLDTMLSLANKGIQQIIDLQREYLSLELA